MAGGKDYNAFHVVNRVTLKWYPCMIASLLLYTELPGYVRKYWPVVYQRKTYVLNVNELVFRRHTSSCFFKLEVSLLNKCLLKIPGKLIKVPYLVFLQTLLSFVAIE